MADPRKVGVQFIVMGEAEFEQAMAQADREFVQFNQQVEIATKNADTFGSNWQRAFQSFRALGATPREAIGGLNEAVERGIAPSKLLAENQNKLFTIIQQLALSGKNWNEIQQEMNTLADKNSSAHLRLTESAVASSRAFFALTLAGFGLMEIERSLQQAYGDDLPVAFERSISAFNQIASFGSAGAFIGGAQGAILGGVTGALLALTTAALQLDPAIQQLNQSLDQMSRKDELAETLSNIAGISEETARIWLEAAQKDPNFAEYLEQVTKKAEPIPGLLASINTLSKELTGTTEGLGQALGTAGDAMNKLLLLSFAGYSGLVTLQDQLLKGVNISDAFAKAQETALRVIQSVEEATQGAGISTAETAAITARANSILADQEDQVQKVTDAFYRMNDALADAAFREEQLAQKTANAYAAAQAQYEQTVANASRERGQAIARAEEDLTNRISDLWMDLQNRITDINQDLADKITDIQTRTANQIADIQAQLALRIQNIQQDLSNKIRDIEQDLQNKREQLAHDYRQQLNKINLDIRQAAQDLSDELYEIERTRIEAIEALAFNTHEQLMSAQTDHDRDRIIRRAQFEQAQIDQTANDARTDALREHEQRLQQFEIEKQLARENYEYELRLAQLLAEQKIAQARLVAAQQVQQAQDSANLQIQQAQRQAALQIAIAQREQQQALELAQRRHQEELAVANRNYQQQVANARQAERDKISDALTALNTRNAAIAQSHEMERQQIERTRQKAIEAYLEVLAAVKAIMDAIVLAQTHMVGFAQSYQNFIDDPLDLKGLNNDFVPIVPTIPNESSTESSIRDAFIPTIERSIVNAPNTTTNNARSQTNYIQVNGGDTEEVRRVIRETLSEAAWGNG